MRLKRLHGRIGEQWRWMKRLNHHYLYLVIMEKRNSNSQLANCLLSWINLRSTLVFCVLTFMICIAMYGTMSATTRRLYTDTINRNILQRHLAKTSLKLRTWENNITRRAELRTRLDEHMKHTSFVCTQENTPIGAQYFDTFHSKKTMGIDAEKQRLLPKVSPFSNTTFKTCSIVGNSGILNNSKCGREIDSWDFVMRSNLQQIQPFVEDAGKKMNLTSLSPSLIVSRYKLFGKEFDVTNLLEAMQEYVGYMLWIPNSKGNAVMTFPVTQLVQENTEIEVLLLNSEHTEKFQEFWQLSKKTISTGLTLVSIALSMCEELHLYGFWPFPLTADGQSVEMHYSGDLQWSSYFSHHDYPSEFDLLTKLHYQGILKLHVDKCY
ncbi:CMP-N-acetylneuraminate-poly-alpha-2,8-sialyltransferase-like [Saccoglossus kowalevskii]|uniref:CMP-N-acetylneuraminate-poly-alpha-2, 8-sialyltransferase-like n=1 Tax=Saccoglossus kowalevskii TaxID=10224 RepID=A0ABM0MYF3_SACKO|nr:PREDICTED: CMP-N-acetylneuraminate-poly-alpha-2,8-sialyltransferase-like [Saccoglossus kowalevskii]